MSALSTIGRAFFRQRLEAAACLLGLPPSTSDRGRTLRACSSVQGNQPTCPPSKSIGCPLREGMATSLRAAEGKEELGSGFGMSLLELDRGLQWSSGEEGGREWWVRVRWARSAVRGWRGDTYGTPEHTLTHWKTQLSKQSPLPARESRHWDWL